MSKPAANVDSIQATSAPFSANHLNQIFQVSPKHADRLISRESGWLEFKDSFNWAGRGSNRRLVMSARFLQAHCGFWGLVVCINVRMLI